MDYYAFGSPLPGRQGAATTGYRYGFNGKENDSETGTQDYGFRIYNPSLGKFLSVDPLSDEYPWNSTYAFAENKPINGIDLEGAEFFATYLAYVQLLKAEAAVKKINALTVDAKTKQASAGVLDKMAFAKGFYYSHMSSTPLQIAEAHQSNKQTVQSIAKSSGTPAQKIQAAKVFVETTTAGVAGSPEGNLVKGTAQTTVDACNGNSQAQGMLVGTGVQMLAGAASAKITPKVPLAEPLSISENIIVTEMDGLVVVNDANGITAGRFSMDGDGIISGTIKTNGTTLKGRGADVFRAMHDYINANYDEVMGIHANWKSVNGLTSNLDAFNSALKNGMSREQAAFSTFTGKQAKALGYNSVEFIQEFKDNTGTYSGVEMIFKK